MKNPIELYRNVFQLPAVCMQKLNSCTIYKKYTIGASLNHGQCLEFKMWFDQFFRDHEEKILHVFQNQPRTQSFTFVNQLTGEKTAR